MAPRVAPWVAMRQAAMTARQTPTRVEQGDCRAAAIQLEAVAAQWTPMRAGQGERSAAARSFLAAAARRRAEAVHSQKEVERSRAAVHIRHRVAGRNPAGGHSREADHSRAGDHNRIRPFHGPPRQAGHGTSAIIRRGET